MQKQEDTPPTYPYMKDSGTPKPQISQSVRRLLTQLKPRVPQPHLLKKGCAPHPQMQKQEDTPLTQILKPGVHLNLRYYSQE